jgi:hypothetical protein
MKLEKLPKVKVIFTIRKQQNVNCWKITCDLFEKFSQIGLRPTDFARNEEKRVNADFHYLFHLVIFSGIPLRFGAPDGLKTNIQTIRAGITPGLSGDSKLHPIASEAQRYGKA